jgi:RNA polymerase sigma-70 factor (ECF subfamily)
MSDESTFTDFLRRVRAGDEQAAVELVRKYEPLIRREVRLRLEDRRLGRIFDSMDVCQSVLASFFVRTAAGQYDLEEPGQLIKLLVTMARNKLASAARRQSQQRRDHRREAAHGAEGLTEVAASGPGPGSIVAGRDLLERFRQGLTEVERQIADLRGKGLSWDEVAAQLGGKAQARRMQLARAVDRLATELGLDEAGP